MKPKTFEELFDQLEIDANNGIAYNKLMYLRQCLEIHENIAQNVFALTDKNKGLKMKSISKMETQVNSVINNLIKERDEWKAKYENEVLKQSI